jgi:hypothetical protein
MRPSLGMSFAALALASAPGCATTQGVRYVYQDGQFGVVGIPENTDRWPTHYRRQAEQLMAAHFPEGHEIVRAEEVVEGSRTLTLKGTNTLELTPQLPPDLFKVGTLGRSASRSQADSLKIKECRIVYRRSPHPAPEAEFSDLATLTPTRYVDPNAPDQRKAAESSGEAKTAKAKEKDKGEEESAETTD